MTFQPPATESKLPDILVIDDTPANLDLLDDMLTARGYRVRAFPLGRLALAAARNRAPDLVLLDIHMPEMSGYELCQCFQADPALKGIPILFISALGETDDKVKAFECGGVDYITKPFQIEEVVARVKTHLNLRLLQQEMATYNARLEDTVRLRTREITEAWSQLAQARDRLAILDQAKSDFLALISHELRTPLNGLFGITDLILDEGRLLPATAELRSHFEHCREKILTIVDDALLLTQIDVDATKFAHVPASLHIALEDAIEHSMDFAKLYKVEIGELPEISETVVGEAELLAKALAALLDTAIRFSTPGNPIRFSHTQSATGVLLSIEATGRAIPEEYLSRFFDVLAIGEAIVPGGDLGLRPVVAERIISLFGGSVTVESIDPPGIRLKVQLKPGRKVAGE